jgi:predicted PurR-regulated permease PerM
MTGQQKQTLLWTGVGLGLILLLYLLGPVLVPFALAAVLAYMLDPAVEWLVRRKLPRNVAVGTVIIALILAVVVLVLILVPVLQREAGLLQQKLPLLIEKLNHQLIPAINARLGTEFQLDSASLRALVSEKLSAGDQNLASTILNSIKVGTNALLGLLGTALLVPVVLFYLLSDWSQLLIRTRSFLPRTWEPKVMRLLREIDEVLAQFLRGQISVMLVLAVYYSTALALAGFHSALPIGLLTGLLIFIPYVGYAFGLILALLSAALEFGNWYGFIVVAVIYGLGQVVESFILTPRLVGERIGLHPLAVIFALMAFGQLFGFVGVLVALPASAALLVLLRHTRDRYFSSDFYRK